MSTSAPLELLTDEYQLAMADSYLAQGIADEPVAFELFVRGLPPGRGFLVAAGLERAVEYLAELQFRRPALDYLRRSDTCSPELCEHLVGLRFDGSLDAVPEGTVVFAGEPLLRVEGGRLACQLAESYLLNQVNFQTLIASKAARVVLAAAGRPVVDFGFRRAHGTDAGVLAARSAYIGGCAGTATVAAGFLWGIPTFGTMAHSYVMGFDSEEEAFVAFLQDHPDRSTLLIDTYDPVAGARSAVAAASRTGVALEAVRIDSGDPVQVSREVRGILDDGGQQHARILCSGDLNEQRIAELVAAGAPIDVFGVGTQLVTSFDAPALGGVYKLVESEGRPVMKVAGDKTTLPGRHQVFRTDRGDVIGLMGEELPGTPLLEPVLRQGALLASLPTLDDARDRAARQIAELPEACRRLTDPVPLAPALSEELTALKESLQ
ncbi:MAG: nicotinate phosphoribosyltransferase [Gaiellales bacterium]